MTSLVAFIVRLVSGLQARWLGAEPVDCQRVYFANHTSTLDAAVLWAALPPLIREKTRPVAAKDYWSANSVRRWLANDIFRALLIERRKVTIENNPLREMLAVLDEGESLIIFPEGGRFAGPEPQEFKGGLFHLAKDRPRGFAPLSGPPLCMGAALSFYRKALRVRRALRPARSEVSR